MNLTSYKYIKYDFELPKEFQSDIWDIPNMDIYLNATPKQRHVWYKRSTVTKNQLDFTLCENAYIREELKYCMYQKYQILSVATLGTAYDYLKHIFKFYNSNNYNSILETDIEVFKSYIVNELHRPIIVPNGSTYYYNGKRKCNKQNVILSYLQTFIKMISHYIESLHPINELDKDIWYANNLKILDKHIDYNRHIDFSEIKNPLFKQQLKDFCKNKLDVICFRSLVKYHHAITMFFSWLQNNYPSIKYLDELDRYMIEEYFFWLRTESNKSQQLINTSILYLKKFFEYGNMYNFEHFPDYNLIINNDYAFKTKKSSKFFTDNELKGLCSVIDKLPKEYGLMLYCLINLGCRINEIVYLEIDKLKQDTNGKYYLLLEQFKTNHTYEKPISDTIATILKHLITKNKKEFGNEAKYIFVNNKNKPISNDVITKNINKQIYQNNILDRNGKLLHFNTHKLRSTMAVNLFREGFKPEAVIKILGQKSLSSLSYYASVIDKDVQEQLKPRIDKDDYLIRNIGNFDNITNFNPIPLCNGFCTKPVELGICKKANSCLECNMFTPSLAHIHVYEMQLQNVNTAITIAEKYNMIMLLNKNLQIKETLEKIISELKKRLDDNE